MLWPRIHFNGQGRQRCGEAASCRHHELWANGSAARYRSVVPIALLASGTRWISRPHLVGEQAGMRGNRCLARLTRYACSDEADEVWRRDQKGGGEEGGAV